MITTHSPKIFGVLRVLVAGYVLLVPLEKPANKDRKSEFSNKPITENRPNDSSSKNTKYAKVISSCKKPLV